MLEAFCTIAVPEASDQAMRYYHSGNLLWVIEQAWSLIVPLLFLLWGTTGKLAVYAKRWGKNWFWTIAIYLLLFIPIFQLLNLPLDVYSGFIREHAYGLSSQTIGAWFVNYGIQFAITVIGALLVVWIFYWLLKKSPRRWWLYSSFVTIGITFILMVVQPIWIDPLFHHYGPLKDKQLEQQILSLASRAGIEHGRVFEVDMSHETKALNAYVIGFGSTNRIVLWDTTIARMTPDQLLFVMGHEMGHYVLHHMWYLLAYLAALALVVFYLTFRSANFLVKRYHRRFGFSQLSNIASLPLLLLLINFYMLLFIPLSNYLTRKIEHEADRFGLEITQNNEAAAQAFIILQQENLVNPRPGLLHKIWLSDHPPLGDRIDFSNSYHPWCESQPLKYGDRFKK